jgi:hypothetical protein
MREWKELYVALGGETRPAELRILIGETQRSIAIRLRELENETNTTAERLEMEDAASTLKILSDETLSWGNQQRNTT